MFVPILISLICIVVCFGRVEMDRGPRLSGSDGLSEKTTPVFQFPPLCVGELVAVIQSPSLCHSSATISAAALARTFGIL